MNNNNYYTHLHNTFINFYTNPTYSKCIKPGTSNLSHWSFWVQRNKPTKRHRDIWKQQWQDLSRKMGKHHQSFIRGLPHNIYEKGGFAKSQTFVISPIKLWVLPGVFIFQLSPLCESSAKYLFRIQSHGGAQFYEGVNLALFCWRGLLHLARNRPFVLEGFGSHRYEENVICLMKFFSREEFKFCKIFKYFVALYWLTFIIPGICIKDVHMRLY